MGMGMASSSMQGAHVRVSVSQYLSSSYLESPVGFQGGVQGVDAAMDASMDASMRQNDVDTIIFRCAHSNTIRDVLCATPGWAENYAGGSAAEYNGRLDLDWDIFWADTAWIHEHYDKLRLDEHQRLNHFRNHYELTRKDLLTKNLKRAKRALEKANEDASRYYFFPTTYALPADYTLVVEEFKRQGGVWIMKPSGKSQGKGIFLIRKLSEIAEWRRVCTNGVEAESYVVQRYIENPYVIGGKKFDVRLYVLVLSYAPLTVYLYRSGFCRFSGSRFSMDDIGNNLVHLTNVAIQKHALDAEKTTGMKWSLKGLKTYLSSRHGDAAVDGAFESVQELIINSLLAVQNTIIHDRHCFELYGYDILFDETLAPWLIEVNASPSLTASDDEDYSLKYVMLQDALRLVDVEGTLWSQDSEIGAAARLSACADRKGVDVDFLPFETVGGFDCIHNANGRYRVRINNPSGLASMLGCDHDIPPRVCPPR